jgi:hypothetical protein
MTLKMALRGFLKRGAKVDPVFQSGPEEGSTNGSTITPLYSELTCTYVVVSKGY